MQHFTAPAKGLRAFHCPQCGVYALQRWRNVYMQGSSEGFQNMTAYDTAVCDSCGRASMWHNGKLIQPDTSSAPQAHPDLPEDIRADYEEARSVFARSPRSSSALLRLAIQKLCIHLGYPGKNLNDDIGALVGAGLPFQVQQALDVVRVVGNNQVHPGELDVRDDPTIAGQLFELLNIIVEDRIARPKAIQALFERLPEGAKKQIAERNAKVTGKA
jgi:hypothetical protein